MCRDAALTPLGRRFVAQLTGTVTRWADDLVPPGCLAEARRAVDDHAVSWRLHHLTPDPALVDRLARDWRARAGQDPPYPVITLSGAIRRPG
ncbi:hypothetical protein NKH77_19370 [Streptomyces sp. M19]